MKSASFILFAALLFAGGAPTANAQAELTPKCETPTVKGDSACWLELDNHDHCYVFITDGVVAGGIGEGVTANWLGQCQDGMMDGRGTLTIKYPHDRYRVTATGSYQNGKRQMDWIIVTHFSPIDEGEYAVSIGQYVDGKKHGKWVDILGGYLVLVTRYTYVHGKKHGPYENTLYSDDGSEISFKSKGLFVDDKKHGKWDEIFAPSVKCVDYSNGEKVSEKEGEC